MQSLEAEIKGDPTKDAQLIIDMALPTGTKLRGVFKKF